MNFFLSVTTMFPCLRITKPSKNSHFISFFQTETSSETKLHMLLVESRKMADNLSNQKSAPDELMQV